MFDQYNRSFITPEEYAKEVGIHPQRVRCKCREGSIPAFKEGRSWRIAKEWIKPTNQGAIRNEG